jgi:hypothetical protein
VLAVGADITGFEAFRTAPGPPRPGSGGRPE